MEFSREDLVTRGNDMARILADPLFQEAVEKVEKQTVASWLAADTPVKREACHARMLALQALLTELKTVVDTRDMSLPGTRRIGRTGL